MSIHIGQRPTTARQHESIRYRETHTASLAGETGHERMARGGGGDRVGRSLTEVEWLDLAQELEQFWSTTHAEQEIDRTHFTLSQVINVPDGFNVVRPSTGFSVVSTFADHVAGDMPLVKVPEANLSMKAERRSEKMEKFLQASYHRFLNEEQQNQVRTMALQFGWAGMAVSQGPIFLPDVWGLAPERDQYDTVEEFEDAEEEYDAIKRTRWPFLWRMVDPRHTFADAGTIGKEFVIIRYQRTVASIRRQWPEFDETEFTKGPRLPSNHLLEWMEGWSETDRVYFVAGKELDWARHRYGKPPFQIRSAGFGDDSGETHERFRSLIFPARSMINQQIRAWCQFDAIMRKTAWSTVLTPENSGLNSIIPGKIVPMKREDIPESATRVLETVDPSVVQALLSEIDSIGTEIEDATYPRVVKGVRAKGVGSGYGQNSLAALGKIKFGVAAVAAQSMLQEFNSDYLRCVEEVVEEPVYIWGPAGRHGFTDLVLGPKDIGGYYYNVVTLNPKLPIDRANEIQIGSVLWNNGQGVIDEATYLQDFAGYEQPEEMRIRRMRDQILRMPQVQQIMMLAAIDELGLLDFLLEKAKQMGMPPEMVLQAFGLLQPPQQQALGPGGAPGGASDLSGAQMNAGPSAQAEPVPGGLNSQGAPMTQAQAAEGAGVAPPGGGFQ